VEHNSIYEGGVEMYKLTREIKNDIVVKHIAGANATKLGKEYGVSTQAISKICRAAGVSINNIAHLRKLTDDQIIEIRIRANSGEFYAELAREFGLNYITISSIVDRRFYKDVD
jgi:Mor family transcriptional regulator